MFFDQDLRGDALPPRTICLTFDDGPGPRTAAIGEFLAGLKISATFFHMGMHARQFPTTVPRLRASGHLVGNHTDTHPALVSFVRDGGDVVSELARTDEAIGASPEGGGPTYFRPPYGDWRDPPDPAHPETPTASSTVARVLNQAGRFPHLVGPVGWDIDSADWKFWLEGRSVAECGQAYLAAIEHVGRGIILLHDSSEREPIRRNNQTEALVRWLCPILLDRGYRFVRLDQVPAVAAAGSVQPLVGFQAETDRWLTCPLDANRVRLAAIDEARDGCVRFGLVPVGVSAGRETVGLLACNGRFLARTETGLVLAAATTPDDSARWQLIARDRGLVEIRTSRQESIVSDGPLHEVCLQADALRPLLFRITDELSDNPPGS